MSSIKSELNIIASSVLTRVRATGDKESTLSLSKLANSFGLNLELIRDALAELIGIGFIELRDPEGNKIDGLPEDCSALSCTMPTVTATVVLQPILHALPREESGKESWVEGETTFYATVLQEREPNSQAGHTGRYIVNIDRQDGDERTLFVSDQIFDSKDEAWGYVDALKNDDAEEAEEVEE